MTKLRYWQATRWPKKKIPSGSVDLIIADPPYNLGKQYGNNFDRKEFNAFMAHSREWLSEASRTLKPTGTIYVFMGFRLISYLFDVLAQPSHFGTKKGPGAQPGAKVCTINSCGTQGFGTSRYGAKAANWPG